MRTLSLLLLLTACGDKDTDTPDDSSIDTTDTGDTADAEPLAELVGDDVAAEETAWAFGVVHLELIESALTGTIVYSEETDSGDLVCEGQLGLSGTAGKADACEDDPCTWSYVYTVDGADISAGKCEYKVKDMALNFADPSAQGMLAYWADAEFWGDTYVQLMLLGYQDSEGWGATHVLEETKTDSYGLDQYDPEAGTVDIDLGGTGVSQPLLHDGECTDVDEPIGELITSDSPLTGSVEEGWDAVVDVWEVSLEAGQTLHASAVGTGGADMELDLISPSGCLQVIGDDWVDCGDSSCGSLSHTAADSGAYQLLVEGDWCPDDTCDYELHLSID